MNHVIILDFFPKNSFHYSGGVSDQQHFPKEFYSKNFQLLKQFIHQQSKLNIKQVEYMGKLEKLSQIEKKLKIFIKRNPPLPEFVNDSTFMIKLIKFRWYFIHYASEWMKDDRNIMMELVKEKQVLFRYASDRLRSDMELLEASLDVSGCENDPFRVVKKLGHSDHPHHSGIVNMFKHPNRIFRYCNSRNISWKLIEKASEFKLNRELIKQAVRYHGVILNYVDLKFRQDPEIVLLAIQTSPSILWKVPFEIRQELDFSLQVANSLGYRYSSNFKEYYNNLGEDFWRIVVVERRIFSSIHLPTNIYTDPELMKIVLRRNGSLLRLCSEEIRDDIQAVQIAISLGISNAKYASKRIRSSDEIATFLINLFPSVISFLEDNIRQNPKYYWLITSPYLENVFKSAPYCIRNNAELVQHFVVTNPHMFEYASDELKKNRDFVWKIFLKNELTFQYASDELKSDLEFVMLCIEKKPLQFHHLSSNLRGNIELIRLAIDTSLKLNLSPNEIRNSIINFIIGSEKDKILNSLEV